MLNRLRQAITESRLGSMDALPEAAAGVHRFPCAHCPHVLHDERGRHAIGCNSHTTARHNAVVRVLADAAERAQIPFSTELSLGALGDVARASPEQRAAADAALARARHSDPTLSRPCDILFRRHMASYGEVLVADVCVASPFALAPTRDGTPGACLALAAERKMRLGGAAVAALGLELTPLVMPVNGRLGDPLRSLLGELSRRLAAFETSCGRADAQARLLQRLSVVVQRANGCALARTGRLLRAGRAQ